jgi:hypothetical protein
MRLDLQTYQELDYFLAAHVHVYASVCQTTA